MKEKKQNYFSYLSKERFLFVILFSIECIVFSYFYSPLRYSDLIWYLDSGQKIINGNAGLDNYIYSPFFSLSTIFIKNIIQNNLGVIIIEILKALYILIGAFFISFLISFKNSKIKVFPKENLIIIIFICFNPFIIKYINPLYSDSFALLAGIFFVFRYFPNLILEQKFKKLFVNKFIVTSKYYYLLFLLTLFRYPVSILILSSLLVDLHNKFYSNRNILLLKIYKFLLSLFSIFGIIFYANNYLNSLEIKTNLFLIILSFIIVSLGFREAFAIDLSDPFSLFNFNKMSEIFINNGIFFSELEIKFSIIIGIILLLFSAFGILGLFFNKHQLLIPFVISFSLLLNSQLIIGFANYRYFLLLLPCIIVGLSLFLINFKDFLYYHLKKNLIC